LKDRVTRLPPVTVPFRDRNDAASWTPSVKYVLADDILQLERDDFKRMKPYSQSTAAAPPTPVVPKANRPPKPVNTFLMFCRQWRKKIMTDNANTSAKDASKILGDMWQKLSDEQRASYIPLAEIENDRRLQEWRIKENMPVSGGAAAAMATTVSSAVRVSANGTTTTTPVVTIAPAPMAGVVTPVATGVSSGAKQLPSGPGSVEDDDEDEDEDEEEEEEEDDEEEEEDDGDDDEDRGATTNANHGVADLPPMGDVDELDLNELDDEDLDLTLLGDHL
jgi:SWI/SNF-related matrix-associated actin-dependent regulator of chromatin subfamily B member 1